MRVTITDRLVGRTAVDGSAVGFVVSCWDDSAEPWTAATPTSVQYRVDDLTCDREIVGWTSASASASQTITVTGAQNTVTWPSQFQFTVRANSGLSSVAVSSRDYFINDIAGLTA